MAHLPQTDEVAADPSRRSPWRALGLLAAVLALVWFCFPGGVVTWIGDHCDTTEPLCGAADAVARGVDDASRATGVAPAFEAARDGLRDALGIAFY